MDFLKGDYYDITIASGMTLWSIAHEVGHAVLLAALAAGFARAAEPDPSWSIHGGVGVAFLIVPSFQLQLETRHWFAGVEAAAGFGGWSVFSSLQIVKAGWIFDTVVHPFLAIGVGHGTAYDGDNLEGGGVAMTAEAGLLLGAGRTFGRIIPFVELPVAFWSVHDPKSRTDWRPGVGLPLFGVRFLL